MYNIIRCFSNQYFNYLFNISYVLQGIDRQDREASPLLNMVKRSRERQAERKSKGPTDREMFRKCIFKAFRNTKISSATNHGNA